MTLVLSPRTRLAELPAGMVMTRRPGAGEAASEGLDEISAHPRVQVETLSPLQFEAVHELVEEVLGDPADATLAETCRDAAAGNPFYLHELLLALKAESRGSGPELEE